MQISATPIRSSCRRLAAPAPTIAGPAGSATPGRWPSTAARAAAKTRTASTTAARSLTAGSPDRRAGHRPNPS